MSVNLIYKHQKKAYALMKEALRKNGRAAYVFPMGCGKSFLPLKYMEEFPDKKVLLVSPNIGIINQFKRYISTYLLNGKKLTRNEFPNFRAITYQKIALAGTIENLKPDVIIFDEIHRMGAENWEPAIDKLISANPNAEIIGMSATPERTDKRNMAYEKPGRDRSFCSSYPATQNPLSAAQNSQLKGLFVCDSGRKATATPVFIPIAAVSIFDWEVEPSNLSQPIVG